MNEFLRKVISIASPFDAKSKLTILRTLSDTPPPRRPRQSPPSSAKRNPKGRIPLWDRTHLDRVFPGPRLIYGRINNYFLAYKKSSKDGAGKGAHSQRPIPLKYSGKLKMKSWVQFLSTPTADTPGTTLLLHFDNRRYLIGDVAEGTQRASIQRKLGLAKVGDIFLTGTIGWGNAGGILGMILTLADVTATQREERKKAAAESRRKNGLEETGKEAEKQWLNIHGGKNLTHLLATARRFVFRKGMPLHTNEFRTQPEPFASFAEPIWQDDMIKVWAMVIEPENKVTRPRKRSHEEFSDESTATSLDDKVETSEEREDRYDQMRKSVVSSMFDSEWRLDALIKTKLSKVHMPAAIFVRHEGKIQRYNGPAWGSDPSVEDVDVLVRNPWPGALVDTLPPTTPSVTSVCYFIKNHPQRGKFNPKAAIELGVKPGADFRKLTNGENITTPAGNVVTPDMVMAKGSDGGGFAVIELPDKSYVAPALSRAEWDSKDIMPGIHAVIWILGPGVLEDERLQKFMQHHTKFQHIVSSKDCCANYLALESPAAAAIRLHLLDAERFPIPKYKNEPGLTPPAGPLPYVKARIGHTLQLEPKPELQTKEIVQYLDTQTVVNEASKEVLELAKIAQEKVSSAEYQTRLDETQKDIPSKDAEIITLGTGSALPSKYRNVSATLLRVPGYGNYLFDCGENTLGQLKRVFGDELPGVLRDLKGIWISHLHADHHLGTASVIKEWALETMAEDTTKNNSLIVASHEGMTKWLNEYSEVEDFGYERVESIVMSREGDYTHEFSPEETQKSGLTLIKACEVQHCHGALAVALTFPNGFKAAYSGDCRPSENFVQIGKDATLLIHEATFDDELASDAKAKKHSTTSEALDIGKRMNARRILLTHFSQRYQKIPVMGEGSDQVAIVAFDYMRCRIGDFAKLEAFKPALVKLYEDKEQ